MESIFIPGVRLYTFRHTAAYLMNLDHAKYRFPFRPTVRLRPLAVEHLQSVQKLVIDAEAIKEKTLRGKMVLLERQSTDPIDQ